MPRNSASRSCTVPPDGKPGGAAPVRASSGSGGGGRSRSPARYSPFTPSTWKYTVSDSSARRISLADCGRLNSTLPCCTITSWASAWALYSSARSKGLLARPWATSQVSARLTGHSSSSGVSIQSRISPNRERCSRWKIFIGGQPLTTGSRPRGNHHYAQASQPGPDSHGSGLRTRSSQGSSPGRARWRCGWGRALSSCAAGGCRPRWRCC